MKKHQLSRRGFLTGLGGIALALPFLDRFGGIASAAPTATGPKRIIVMTYQMGIPNGAWRPSAVGSTFSLPYVTAPLDAFKSRCLFVSDIDNTMLGKGGSAFTNGHPGKCESALTGTLTARAFPTTNSNRVDQILASPSTKGGANSASVEHIIGQSLYAGQPLRSVDLAIDGSVHKGTGLAGLPASRFFFEGRDTPVSMRWNPTEANAHYFASVANPGDTQAAAALKALRERDKSVLDAVRDSYADVARDLGADDRRRLEEHAARIRQIEIDAGTAATCTKPTGSTSAVGKKMDAIAAQQIQIMAQAMFCNLAPVGRIEFTNQQNPRFGISALDGALDTAESSAYDWHSMVHGDPLPGTSTRLRPNSTSGTYDSKLLSGYRFFVQQFANLLTALDALPEGNGKSVLDNSLVILASDFGEGLGHYHGKMGYILAGNLGGARTNYHFRAGTSSGLYDTSKYEVIQLLNSICDMAGVSVNGAGASVGLQNYLTQAGKPRRIDGVFA